MRKTVRTLSDGRDIIYFDDDDQSVREAADARDLSATTTTSEVRYDPLADEWVGYAGHRQTRTHLPPANQCPLCPTQPGEHQSEIPESAYDVVVFQNRFPSFATDVPDVGFTVDPPNTNASGPDIAELYLRQPGHGRCEVVCFTSDHNSAFSALTPDRARVVIEAWADRTRELGALPHVEQVFCFENRGQEIGVTLHHPHGQIYAYPFVTPRTRQLLSSAERHRERTWRNLFGDILAAEVSAGTRIVAQSEYWTAFVPAFARWPVEIHLYPNRQVPDFPALTDAERDDLSHIYLDILRRCDALYDAPLPYIASWQQAPVRVGRDLAWLHLQLVSIRRAPGKLKYLAGSESGMGAFISDVFPEAVAARLREVG